MEKIHAKGKALTDEHARERIFYGINVCDKGVYSEEKGRRTYSFDWSDEMVESIRSQGFNVIRLGMTWDAVEPERGEYNEEYLAAVRRNLDRCEKAGIFVYLDMHQDLFSSWGDGPGDGAPYWATKTDKYKYKNPQLVWAESYFISRATHRAFDNFWENKYSLLDDFCEMWKHVVKRLGDHPAVFGYDVFNEPFPGKDGGKVFRQIIGSLVKTTICDKRLSIRKMLGKVIAGKPVEVLEFYDADIFKKIVNKAAPLVNKFDTQRYMPFLNKVYSGIRETDKDSVLFIENCYYSNLGIECAVSPIEIDGKRDDNQLFAPHAYDLMVDTPMYKYAHNGRVKAIFDQRKKEQDENLDMPVLVGEWGGISDGTSWLHHIEFLLALFDEYKWSSTYWAYFGGIEDSPIWPVLKRPYPIAVTGKINSYVHNRDENTFTLSYTQDGEYDVPTEIFAHKSVKSVETDGSYEIVKTGEGTSKVLIKTAPGEHTVKLCFEGEGMSYLTQKNKENA